MLEERSGAPQVQFSELDTVPQSSVTRHAPGMVPVKHCDLVFSSPTYLNTLPPVL